MALLVSVVLGDVVKVVATDNDSSVHLGGDDGTSQNSSTDRDLTDKGALLVDVGTLDGLLGGLETKTDILIPTLGLLGDLGLGVLEDMGLLLESTLRLDGELGRHDLGGLERRRQIREYRPRWARVGVKFEKH